jgi:hypothetical protein
MSVVAKAWSRDRQNEKSETIFCHQHGTEMASALVGAFPLSKRSKKILWGG